MNLDHNTSTIGCSSGTSVVATRTRTCTQPLMRLTGASKLYDKGSATHEALRSVDLDIHRGEFTAIVGPSGSGKSALMKMLGLLEAPTSGGYRFQGVPEQSLSDEQRLWLRRRFFGFVPQEYNLLRTHSLQGNVALPLMYRGLSPERCLTAATRALSLVGLEDCGRKMPDELTGTEHGKAGIARALVCNPSVLLVDRASRASDQPLCPDIGTLLRRLNTEHLITVVLVSQKASAADWAQRVIHVNGGAVEHHTTHEAASALH
ncbi:ABC transporter ATP-binding protein [Hydrogenophaga sp. Root209]|uniref:ABC transporter ATP-binding protein n=1 Tax=Hydrogenophaga sp. Root209 TaxID=1736490 RepID=UPI0009EBAF1E|nr:ATP-binding cassette domain-containing protein [Hydrogenophaga sp. Root209]